MLNSCNSSAWIVQYYKHVARASRARAHPRAHSTRSTRRTQHTAHAAHGAGSTAHAVYTARSTRCAHCTRRTRRTAQATEFARSAHLTQGTLHAAHTARSAHGTQRSTRSANCTQRKVDAIERRARAPAYDCEPMQCANSAPAQFPERALRECREMERGDTPANLARRARGHCKTPCARRAKTKARRAKLVVYHLTNLPAQPMERRASSYANDVPR